jgi:hypothetical protein
MQMEQELLSDLMYMERLEPFLVSMEQFGEITEAMHLFQDHSHSMAYVWVCNLEQLPLDYRCHNS